MPQFKGKQGFRAINRQRYWSNLLSLRMSPKKGFVPIIGYYLDQKDFSQQQVCKFFHSPLNV